VLANRRMPISEANLKAKIILNSKFYVLKDPLQRVTKFTQKRPKDNPLEQSADWYGKKQDGYQRTRIQIR